MAVELRTLRVSAEMDATKYVAGAAQKSAADAKMVAGSKQVSVALGETSAKIGRAADPVARLSRQFVDGAGNALRFVETILAEYGISVSPMHRYPPPGATRAIGTLERIRNKFGEGHLRLILSTLAETTNNKICLDEVGIWTCSDMIRAFSHALEKDASRWLDAWDQMPCGQMQFQISGLRGIIPQRFALGGLYFVWLSDFLDTAEDEPARHCTRAQMIAIGHDLIRVEGEMRPDRFELWVRWRAKLPLARARRYMNLAREAEAAEAGEAA